MAKGNLVQLREIGKWNIEEVSQTIYQQGNLKELLYDLPNALHSCRLRDRHP